VARLGQRIATASVYGAVLLAAILLEGPWFTLVLLALFLVGAFELQRLARLLARPSWRATAFVVGLVVLAGGLYSLLYLTSFAQLPGVPASGGPAPLPPVRWPWVVMALIPTWAADIAAYAVGSLVGRHKLAPAVSPGKTWEGTIGGFVAAALAAWFVGSEVFIQDLPMNLNAFLAVAIGPVALAGDLLESALKRAAGVKDSGAIFPGHGGVLDRIDSLLLVSPVVALALEAYRSGMMEL
jgi:phosphatidate cytidylyltransferase